MVDISNIAQVSIVAQTNGLQQAGFGIPLILGNTSSSIPKGGFNIYTGMSGVNSDFNSSAPEWKMANGIFAQTPAPQQIFIARELDRVAQVATIVFNVDLITGNTINGDINNTVISVPFNTDNEQTLDDLATALTIAGISNAVDTGAHTVTVTSAVAGISFILSSWSVTGGVSQPTTTVTTTVANVGFAEDLASVSNVNDNYYGVLWTERTKADVLYAMSVIEGLEKIFLTATNDTACYDPASVTDVMYLCKAAGYTKSGVLYSAVFNTAMPDACWMGARFPFPPGSANWAYVILNGVTADNLTQSQFVAITNKNGNCYVPFANINGTWKGWMGSGLYIDLRIGIDWTISTMRQEIAQAILQPLAGNKIPYTDQGVGVLEAAMNGVLELGVKNQFIQPGYSVTAGKAADQSDIDKAARFFPDLHFHALFTNAIDTAAVQGVLQF